MRLVARLVLATCVVSACAATARAQTGVNDQPLRLTEREAVARFMASDPRIRAWETRIDEVRAAQSERTLWPNPSVTYSRESVFDARDTFVLARQELPLSGRRAQLQAAGRFAVQAAEAGRRVALAESQADLRQAYLAVLLAQEREALFRSAIDELQKLVTILRVREEAGEGSRYDRMRGARAVLDLEAERALAAAARAQAQGRLAGYLGPDIVPDTLVAAEALAAPADAPPVAALIEQALSARGEYHSAQVSIERFEAERGAAAQLRIPTPIVTGGLKRSAFATTTRAGYQFSVDVAVPLFSHGQAASRLAGAQKAGAEAEAASWRARIEADVRAAHAVLAIHRERVERYRQSSVDIAEPLAATGRVGYEEGELGILELLDANRQATDARLRVLELTADARRAAIDLDRVIGTEWRP